MNRLLKVKEVFSLTKEQKDFMAEKSEDSSYWLNALEFYEEVENKDYVSLSNKQIQWLESILDGVAHV
jgi:hypothetical protein